MVASNTVRNGWRRQLSEYLSVPAGRVHLIGTGNQLRGDDAVGLYIVGRIRKLYGRFLPAGVKIHPASLNPEMLMSKVGMLQEKMVVFDAVECNSSPGTIICSDLTDTKYGFFATHNIPMRLIPSLSAGSGTALVTGIQPLSLEVAEGLSGPVRTSADEIVRYLGETFGVV
jgi:hydrogenase 3 maturation protease